MAEAKTRATDVSPSSFIGAIKNPAMRRDCRTIAGIMARATRAKPRMWGADLVGFGTYRCTYANGREAEWMITAFAPRRDRITLYVASGFSERKALLGQLGKHSAGKSCVHIKQLADVDLPTLERLVKASVKHVRSAQKAG